MTKTISAGLSTHLAQTVTTLCTLWRITRTDGENFYFTDHDVAIVFDDGDGSATYDAETGYSRTAIKNGVGLNVDNLDVQGLFDSDNITEEDLRAGKFDFAEIKVYIVNWADLTQGAMKVRRGWFGEVQILPSGIFKAELRGLTQPLSQNIVSLYQPECRVDLGSTLCTVPIRPDEIARSTAYSTTGVYFRVPTASTTGITWANLLNNGVFELDSVNNSTNASAVTGWTIDSGGWRVADSINTIVPRNGSAFLGGTATVGGSGSISQIIDLVKVGVSASQIDAGNCTATFDGWVANSTGLTDTTEILCTFLNSAQVYISDMYHQTAETVAPGTTWANRNSGAIAIPANTRYIKVVLSNVDTLAGGAQVGFDDLTVSVSDTTLTNTFQEIYENIQYELTTAGTTAGTQPTYDTTPGNTTTDGSAVLTARNSYTRHGEIYNVENNSTVYVTMTGTSPSDDEYNGGALIFEGGINDSVVREIRNFTASTGKFELFIPPTFPPLAGMKVRFYKGCDKRLATCRDTFSNAINFQGEPYVPGQDQLTDYPDAR